MKIAVYVEGQAELIFVRELLCKWYEYDCSQIGFRCYNLRDANPPGYSTDYPYGDEQAKNFYEIVNVGTDIAVLGKALKSAPKYRSKGYDRIVALRDMYSKEYHEEAYKICSQRTIHRQINQKFIEGAKNSISQKSCSDFVHINFAIMEIEAWFLGMGWYLKDENPILTQEYLKEQHNLDLDSDQEATEYHPANKLDEIYKGINSSYDKHEHQINTIMSRLSKDDFEMLLSLPKCDSFNQFIANLIPTLK